MSRTLIQVDRFHRYSMTTIAISLVILLALQCSDATASFSSSERSSDEFFLSELEFDSEFDAANVPTPSVRHAYTEAFQPQMGNENVHDTVHPHVQAFTPSSYTLQYPINFFVQQASQAWNLQFTDSCTSSCNPSAQLIPTGCAGTFSSTTLQPGGTAFITYTLASTLTPGGVDDCQLSTNNAGDSVQSMKFAYGNGPVTSHSPATGDISTLFTITVTMDPLSATGSILFSDINGPVTTCGSGGTVALSAGTASCAIYAAHAGIVSYSAAFTGSGSYASIKGSGVELISVSSITASLSLLVTDPNPLAANTPSSLQISASVSPTAATAVHLSCTSSVTNTIVANLDFTIASGATVSEKKEWTPPRVGTDDLLACAITVTSSADSRFSSLGSTSFSQLVLGNYQLPETIYIFGKVVPAIV